MRRAHTVEQVRAAEEELLAQLPDGVLMQRAAAGLAHAVIDFLGSAYGRIASSPSSTRQIVRAPRARTSWMPLTILSRSWSRPAGGTTQNTGRPSSTSAIGPCLSSPAAKPSAWR